MKTNEMAHLNPTAVTRSQDDIIQPTGNLYRSLAIVAKRSGQINLKMREELHSKLNEFATHTDNLEEVFENREQIEISRFYERLPNPALLATEEFLRGETYFRDPEVEEDDK